MLNKVVNKHAQLLLVALTSKLQSDPRGEFSEPGVVVADEDSEQYCISHVHKVSDRYLPALNIHLCTDETVTINIDIRTGRLNLRDINSLAVAGRAPRFNSVAFRLNQEPATLVGLLSDLRTTVRKPLSSLHLNALLTNPSPDHHRSCRGEGSISWLSVL